MTTAQPDLRASQVADTRDRIARATIDVVLRDGPASLTFPAVAEQAGVSLRTVYRHFPNKDDLLLAAVESGTVRARGVFPPGTTVGVDQLRELLPQLWSELEARRDLVALQHAVPAGVRARRERFVARGAAVESSLERDYGDIPAADRARLSKLIAVLIGSNVLLELVDLMDVDVAEAAFLSAYAIEAVTERARREGGIR